jgi:hypothetical protein
MLSNRPPSKADERPNIITFTPLDVEYNPLHLQSMPSPLYFNHADSLEDPIRYLVRPPRLRSDLRGDTYWAPWWRTAILVQYSTALPLPSMSAHDPHTPQGYLMQALLGSIAMATSYLSSNNNIASDYASAPPTLVPSPDGLYIISHLHKDTSSQLQTSSYIYGQPPHICHDIHHGHPGQNPSLNHYHY